MDHTHAELLRIAEDQANNDHAKTLDDAIKALIQKWRKDKGWDRLVESKQSSFVGGTYVSGALSERESPFEDGATILEQ